jgi:hypothetical protein
MPRAAIGCTRRGRVSRSSNEDAESAADERTHRTHRLAARGIDAKAHRARQRASARHLTQRGRSRSRIDARAPAAEIVALPRLSRGRVCACGSVAPFAVLPPFVSPSLLAYRARVCEGAVRSEVEWWTTAIDSARREEGARIARRERTIRRVGRCARTHAERRTEANEEEESGEHISVRSERIGGMVARRPLDSKRARHHPSAG